MKLQIETYHGCNARCSICTINRWQRTKGPIDDELFYTIIEQAKDLPKLDVVSLYMDGEPLLDKAIFQRVRSCKAAGLPHVGFSTNASLLDRLSSKKLLEASMDWIAISLDSMDKASYEAVRTRLDHTTVVKNVHALIEERNALNHPLEIALRFLNHEGNAQSFEEYEEYWKQYLCETDKLVSIHCHNWGEDDQEPKEILTRPCSHPFSNMVVLNNGAVPMCCVDYNAEVEMGHVQKQTLAEIWSGSAFEQVRNLHRENRRMEIERCKYCTV